MSKEGITYKDAGVDIEAAERALEMSERAIDSTWQPHVLRGVGLFGGMVDLKMASQGIKDPALVQVMLGRSFKLKENSHLSESRDMIFKCLENMPNSLTGIDVRGLSFLDYIASSKLNSSINSEAITEMAEVCRVRHIPIIGGETAEMPGIYQKDGMEIAGVMTAIAPHDMVDEKPGVIVYSPLYEIFEYKLYRNPVLVQSIDGVGTKTMLAKDYSSNVEDLVNHCINDIAVQGAKPLFMMVYTDADAWQKGTKEQLREGVEKAKAQVELKIIFSKPHPEVYQSNQIDLVGCVTGVAEREEIIDGSRIKPGDRLIGLASSGPHTNGYSLIRKIIKIKRLKLDQYMDELDCTLGEALRKPHRSYLSQIQGLMRECDVKGFAHITGGGLIDNVSRILPDGCKAFIHEYVWQVPEIFWLIQKWGNVPEEDMWHTFNMGIGLVAMVSPEEQEKALKFLKNIGETAYLIGEVRKRERKVIII